MYYIENTGAHLRFYMHCINNNYEMPYPGLCKSALNGLIDISILHDCFTPEDFSTAITFWASGEKGDCEFLFTPLRQTIVLFMAAMNDEL